MRVRKDRQVRKDQQVTRALKEQLRRSPAPKDFPVLLVPLDHKDRREPPAAQEVPALLAPKVLQEQEHRGPKGYRVLLALSVLSGLLVVVGLLALKALLVRIL